MSYRSRSRSPEYRYRRYSPSRPRSRSPSLPPRRYDDPPRRYDDYGPSASGRYDDRIPPPRRYNDEYSPPPGSRDRYEKDLPPRRERYEEEFPPRTRERYEDERSTSRGSREPSVDKRGQGYDERPVRGMAADREEVRVPKREPMKAAEPAWERGRDVEELAVSKATQR
jgi:RNA-binding protein 5/10